MNRNALVIGVLMVGFVVSAVVRFGFTSNQQVEANTPTTESNKLRYTFDQSAFDTTSPPKKVKDGSPNISTKAAYLVDVDSGYQLYGLNEDEPVPIASTTKLMTAAIVVESYKLSDEVTISPDASLAIGSEINLLPGEIITVESLLKALLIQSGNDAAMALAEHMGLDKFIAAMNSKAVELGMEKTHYKDPAGLDDEGQSTARDLGIIASYVLRHPPITGIVRLPEANLQSVDGRFQHHVKNSNRLIIPDSPFYLPQATGLKTGFTPDAGHCLVASAEYNGHSLIAVILGTVEQTAEASAKESRKLLTWGFDAFQWE